MTEVESSRILAERPLPRDGQERDARQGLRPRPARTVTVNLAESPLGWLKARGLITRRQFDAGERLRADWETAQLAPSVTMRWDSAPLGKTARAAPEPRDPNSAQIAARRRFEAAVREAGPGLADILWRVVCAGEGMRDSERALGWPARAGRLVLTLALDRLAAYYKIA
ncbi:MAG TPA: DUF6456 domain-containing protein [Allosphingosinicella sp.]|nr:DUF6456 domain-containing protein [Allosphingosinicella sp.]